MTTLFAKRRQWAVRVARARFRRHYDQHTLAWKQTKGVAWDFVTPVLPGSHLRRAGRWAPDVLGRQNRQAALRQERLGAEGEYYASPIAANGHIYLASSRGTITTVLAGDALEVEARNDLANPSLATPAIADDKLLVRSAATFGRLGRK